MALGADARLNRYSNARWPDHLPEVLTSVLRRSLEATGSYVTGESSGHGADNWRLQLEARKFYGLQDAAGETGSVAVELAGNRERLIGATTGQVVAETVEVPLRYQSETVGYLVIETSTSGTAEIEGLPYVAAVGGDSIRGMQVVARLQASTGVDLSLVTLFRKPTVT